ncbi:uncharacterized protein LOC106070975 isoform X2 [Biomphalaria glabrata]|uniref:Uncharacterized protein LOC106070975 isoform X2 n=1 Tax=Biomphalaria glabrata TaxID=6526 RepID=A0A9W3ALI4_BIOGL|nr:uncharacterized protein LOC106070975 isoform X2 [Biomphalaria glabrata]
MEQQAVLNKTNQDIHDLIRLFLSEQFDPFGEDVGREEADAFGVNDDYDFTYYTEKLGRTLAQCGDDFLKPANREASAENRNLREIFTGIDQQNEEEAQKKFNEIMSKSIKDSGITNPIQIFRSVLLTLHGLKSLGRGVTMFASKLAEKFVIQRALNEDIARVGGLKKFLATQLD